MKLFLFAEGEQIKNFLVPASGTGETQGFPLCGSGMLTVLIETQNDEDGLTRTLASLIGGAVEGVVRDVIVCDRGSTDQTHRVAEHAGCNFISGGGVAAGIRQAKGEWLLMLEPGARLVDGWMEPVLGRAAAGRRSFRAPSRGRPRLPRGWSSPSARRRRCRATRKAPRRSRAGWPRGSWRARSSSRRRGSSPRKAGRQ
jgi:glycosyltransferase involved in cell wall biosynthesis